MKNAFEIKISALWGCVAVLQAIDLEALAPEVRENGSDADRHLFEHALEFRAKIDAYQAEEWG
jgi:hypothetical protein